MPGLVNFFLCLIREDGRRRRFAARGWHCTVSAESDDKVTRPLAAALDVASAPMDTAIAPLHTATTPQRWPAPPRQEMASPGPRSRLQRGFRLRLQHRSTRPASSSSCRSQTAPEGRPKPLARRRSRSLETRTPARVAAPPGLRVSPPPCRTRHHRPRARSPDRTARSPRAWRDAAASSVAPSPPSTAALVVAPVSPPIYPTAPLQAPSTSPHPRKMEARQRAAREQRRMRRRHPGVDLVRRIGGSLP
ncbi:hypothetical protein VPH35_027713 [Triticum aestivum]|uniref:mucin-7 n=1 Tax=Triticum aestivum TaxID=4565 RepID=UPI000E7B5F5D|nr:mucin-7-like [Triticum aestivum]